MTHLILNFERYDDPARAADIWYAYLPDVERLGLLTRAEGLVYSYAKRQDLDLGLDNLISEKERRLSIRSRC
ncbi:hypothetical protein J4422_02490 [Candidatus Pacearchaeota archaeon]|nr:hypothetical protein [Candidatus Pacearchaeota archaeon]